MTVVNAIEPTDRPHSTLFIATGAALAGAALGAGLGIPAGAVATITQAGRGLYAVVNNAGVLIVSRAFRTRSPPHNAPVFAWGCGTWSGGRAAWPGNHLRAIGGAPRPV